MSWDVVNATLATHRNPGGVAAIRWGRGYNVRHARLLRISRRRGARMKLIEWAGRPQTHIVGLFVSLLAVLTVVGVMLGTLEYTNTRGRLLLTALLTGGYFLTSLPATAMPRAGAGRGLRPAVLALAMAALLLLLSGLWLTPDSDGYWKATAIVTLLVLGLACSGLALTVGLKVRGGRAFGWATAVLMALLTALAGLGIALEIRISLYWWICVLLALCWVAVSAGIPLAWYWRGRGRAG